MNEQQIQKIKAAKLTPKETLRAIIKAERMNYDEFTELLKSKKKSQIKNFMGGSQKFPEDLAIKLSEKYKDFPVKFWLTGSMLIEAQEKADCILLPIIEASAGDGVYAEIGTLSVPVSELKNIGYIKYDNLLIIRIKGQSMTPKINDQDILVLDKECKIQDGDICVISYEGSIYCKKILFNVNEIILKSENPDYTPVSIKDQERGKLDIIGKVIYRINAF